MVNSNGKKAVFFDLDDTLYDLLDPLRGAALEVLSPEHGELPFTELFYRVRHHSDVLWAQYTGGEMELGEMRELRLQHAFAEFGVELDRDTARRMQEAYQSRQGRITLMEGADGQLQRFLAEGYTVGLITNGLEDHQMYKIRALGLDKLIPAERIFISDAVGLTKPDPALFAHVNEATETEPENSLYIGDTWENDVVGALDAGWRVCWFNARGRKPATGHKPTFVFGNYKEFAALPLF